MPKEEREKEVTEIPWTPDKPLADEEDERETIRKAQANARLAHLQKQYETPAVKDKKQKDGRSKLW